MNTNITWDDVPTQAMHDDDDTAKCYSCNGWFPVSSCVLNTEDDGQPYQYAKRVHQVEYYEKQTTKEIPSEAKE